MISDERLDAYITGLDPSVLQEHLRKIVAENKVARAHLVDLSKLVTGSAKVKAEMQWDSIASILEECLELISARRIDPVYLQSAIPVIMDMVERDPALDLEGLAALIDLAFAAREKRDYGLKVGDGNSPDLLGEIYPPTRHIWLNRKDQGARLADSTEEKLDYLRDAEPKTYGRMERPEDLGCNHEWF
jgi:hypothetical protein